MVSLHDLMRNIREKYKNWQKENPYDHPAKLHRIMAEEIVIAAQALGAKEVSLHETVFAGGVPEYAQAVAALREAEILVNKEKDS